MASGSPSSSPDTATGSGTDPARPDTGEPLGGAGSDSDSDLGLSKFDCSAMEVGDRLEGEELEREFECAADRVKDLIQTASRDQLLYLYARYKQVIVRLSVTVCVSATLESLRVVAPRCFRRDTPAMNLSIYVTPLVFNR